MSGTLRNVSGSTTNGVPINPLSALTPTIHDSRRILSAPSKVHENIHELEGDSNITWPPPNPRRRHLSELIGKLYSYKAFRVGET